MGSASPHAFQCRLGDHRPIPSRSQLFEPPCDPFFALMRQRQTAWHRHGRKPSKSCSVLQGMGQRDAVSQGLPCTPDVHCREVPVKGGCQAEIRLPLGKGSPDGLEKPSPVSLGRKLRPLRRIGSSSCLTAPFPSCGRPSRVLGDRQSTDRAGCWGDRGAALATLSHPEVRRSHLWLTSPHCQQPVKSPQLSKACSH